MSDLPTSQAHSKWDRIDAALKLNKDQKKTVRALLDETQKDAGPLREQIASSRGQIADALAAGKSQDDIKPLVDSYSAVEAQMAALEMKTLTKIMASLDDTQKADKQGVGTAFVMLHGMFRGKAWNED